MPSTNMAFRSLPKLPKTSASDIKPPGLTPMMNRPLSIWSIMAAWAAIAAGCELGTLIVPVPSMMFLVSEIKLAKKIIDDVTVSAASVTCSPTYASLKPKRSAKMTASRSSARVSAILRPGGCSGIMKVLYFKSFSSIVKRICVKTFHTQRLASNFLGKTTM